MCRSDKRHTFKQKAVECCVIFKAHAKSNKSEWVLLAKEKKNLEQPTENDCFTFLARVQPVPKTAVAPGLERARDDADTVNTDVLQIAWKSACLSVQ